MVANPSAKLPPLPTGFNPSSIVDAIEAIDQRLEGVSFQGTLPSAVRKLIQNKQDLIALWEKTTQQQRDAYSGKSGCGEAAWNQDYQLLFKLDRDPSGVIFQEGVIFRERLVREALTIGGDPALRYQLALSDYRDIAVRREMELYRNGQGRLKIRRSRDRDPNVALADDIDASVFTRAPKSLVGRAGLKLVDLTAFKGKPLELRKEILSPEVQKELKNILKRAVPLGVKSNDPNLRVLVVQSGHSRERANEPKIFGSILCFRTGPVPGEKSKWRQNLGKIPKMSIQCFAEAYSFYRSECHVTETEFKDAFRIGDLAIKLQNINNRIAREFPIKELRDGLETSLAKVIEDARKLLKDTKSENKKAAKEVLFKATGLKDRMGKANSGPAQFRITGGLEHLEKRDESIQRIDDRISSDATSIFLEIHDHEMIFLELRKAVSKSESVFNKYRDLFDSSVQLNDRVLESKKRAFLAELKFHPEDLSSIWLRPFTTFADKIRENYALLESAVESRDGAEVIKALIAMNIVCKYNATAVACGKISAHMTKEAIKPDWSPHKLFGFLSTLISAHEIFPNHRVWSYDSLYQKLKVFVSNLRQELESIGDNAQDYLDEGKTKALKNYLKNYDAESEAAKLVRVVNEHGPRPNGTAN